MADSEVELPSGSEIEHETVSFQVVGGARTACLLKNESEPTEATTKASVFMGQLSLLMDPNLDDLSMTKMKFG